MTYVIDLKRLWEDKTRITASQKQAAAKVYLDPRQNIVSVIIAIHGENLYLQTLQAALNQLLVREVVVVNCSHSPQVEEALTQFSQSHTRVLVVAGQHTKGLASAYNLGARYATTQYFLFLTQDCLLPKNAVLKLLATGIRKPKPWVIGALSTAASSTNGHLLKLSKLSQLD